MSRFLSTAPSGLSEAGLRVHARRLEQAQRTRVREAAEIGDARFGIFTELRRRGLEAEYPHGPHCRIRPVTREELASP